VLALFVEFEVCFVAVVVVATATAAGAGAVVTG